MGIAPRFVARWELDGVGGVVVAVDVLRAFTTAAYALAAGASSIWLVGGVDEALALGREIPGALVMGEDRGRRPPGFDLSNSPVEVAEADVEGRVLVQRTSAGTQGVLAAASAERLFAASLVCASATAAAIRRIDLGAPTYVITGRFPDHPDGGEDDLLTAKLIERARTGCELGSAATAEAVAQSPEAARTLALGDAHTHPDDIAYATAVDRFAFAMEVERVEGRPRLVRRAVMIGAVSVQFRAGRVDEAPGAELLRAMKEEMADLYEGLDLDAPEMPKAGPEELSPPTGAFLIGWDRDRPVCCGGVKRLPDGACEIKRMFVVPGARRQGVARGLLRALEAEARRLGYAVARLDTGPKQPHAKALYAAEGYTEVANFNANPVADYFAEKAL